MVFEHIFNATQKGLGSLIHMFSMTRSIWFICHFPPMVSPHTWQNKWSIQHTYICDCLNHSLFSGGVDIVHAILPISIIVKLFSIYKETIFIEYAFLVYGRIDSWIYTFINSNATIVISRLQWKIEIFLWL